MIKIGVDSHQANILLYSKNKSGLSMIKDGIVLFFYMNPLKTKVQNVVFKKEKYYAYEFMAEIEEPEYLKKVLNTIEEYNKDKEEKDKIFAKYFLIMAKDKIFVNTDKDNTYYKFKYAIKDKKCYTLISKDQDLRKLVQDLLGFKSSLDKNFNTLKKINYFLKLFNQSIEGYDFINEYEFK